MKRSSRPRKIANLSESIHHQLNMYALAASAAGVGLLALSQAAEAKIVYRATHHVIGKNAHYALDLNHDGFTDVTFVNSYGCNQDYCYDVLNANAAAGDGIEGKKGFLSIPYAYVVPRGSHIGPMRPFSGQLMASSNMGTIGRWLNVNNGYLGLKFKIKSKIHYGWARLNVHLSNGVIKALLTGYAYETIPGKSIRAGQTFDILPPTANSPSPDDSSHDASLANPIPDTPQPASLGMLALGAQAVPWRRKESVGATQ